jgi:hypothetical protein
VIVLIAADMGDGRAWIGRQPRPGPVVVVTPRSPDGCRGVTADAILVTDLASMHPKLDELVAVALPSIMATR